MKFLKIFLMIFAVLVTDIRYASGQDCKIIDSDIVEIKGEQFLVLSKDRSKKIKDDLELFSLTKRENALLEAKNRELTSQLVFLKDQLSFYQKQVSMLLAEPKTKNMEVPAIYPVVGAFILGNLTSSLAFGYWSSQISRVQ